MRRLVLGAIFAGGIAGAAFGADPMPANPQPDPAALKQGLTVKYYYQLVRHVDQIEPMLRASGEPGEPLTHLDFKVGEDTVLTSDTQDGVGALITGFLHFEEAGPYAFAAESNDGIKVTIGGVQAVYDPDVHSDRFSEIIDVDIPEPGWYPIEIIYFERKSTSTLRLMWQTPTGANMEIVPPEALAYLP